MVKKPWLLARWEKVVMAFKIPIQNTSSQRKLQMPPSLPQRVKAEMWRIRFFNHGFTGSAFRGGHTAGLPSIYLQLLVDAVNAWGLSLSLPFHTAFCCNLACLPLFNSRLMWLNKVIHGSNFTCPNRKGTKPCYHSKCLLFYLIQFNNGGGGGEQILMGKHRHCLVFASDEMTLSNKNICHP